MPRPEPSSRVLLRHRLLPLLLFCLFPAAGFAPAHGAVPEGKSWSERDPGDRMRRVSRAPGRDARLMRYSRGVIEFVEVRPPAPFGGVPVVYIHGLGGNFGDFGPSLLAESPYTRIALNLPGTGRSTGPPAGFTIEAFAEVLREILVARMGHTRLDLVCHSLGGQVCLAFALEFPSHVASLALIDAAGTYDQGEFVRRMAKQFAGVNLGKVLVSNHPAISVVTGGDQNILDRMVGGNAPLIAALSSFGRNYRARIPAVSSPVLLIWGQSDPIFTIENAFHLLNNIPGSRLKVVPGGGHVPQLTHPDLVDAWILEFRNGRAEKNGETP